MHKSHLILKFNEINTNILVFLFFLIWKNINIVYTIYDAPKILYYE